MAEPMPAWFLAHGAPLHLLGDTPVRRFWERLPDFLPRQPQAILCLSAHWLTQIPALSGMAPNPGIQHDFYGFPDALYRMRWTLQDHPQTDQWLIERLTGLLPDLELEPDHALDRGTWVPLINAWPKPAFPVYQLSLCPERETRWHLELGRRLASLREKDVLIIGSGGLVHNLRRIDWRANRGQPASWAATFMQALEAAIEEKNVDALCDPWSLPHGRDCVPTIEHYLPLLVTLGTATDDEPIRPLYEGWEYGSLALHSYTVSCPDADNTPGTENAAQITTRENSDERRRKPA